MTGAFHAILGQSVGIGQGENWRSRPLDFGTRRELEPRQTRVKPIFGDQRIMRSLGLDRNQFTS